MPDNTHINIIGYNRIAYFTRVVEALSKNRQLPTTVYLDNCGDQGIIDQHLVCVQKYLPHAEIILRPQRLGPGHNIVGAYNDAFNRGCDRLFTFEDDLVVSPHYIDLCLNLADWVRKNAPMKIGMVQAWPDAWYQFPETTLPRPEIDEIAPTVTHAWGYLMFKETWADLKPMVERYLSIFQGPTTSPHDEQNIYAYLRTIQFERMYDEATDRWMHSGVGNGALDGIIALGLAHHGYYRVTATKSRAEYIGEVGHYGRKQDYDAMRLGIPKMFVDPADETRTEFKFRAGSLDNVTKLTGISPS